MDRISAVKFAKEKLVQYGLDGWRVVINQNLETKFYGLCDYNAKSIILNGYAIDMRPDVDVIDTILHEVAHALCPGASHGVVWANKCEELGCKPSPCASYAIPDHVLDAIRSGHNVELETETIQIPRYKVTQLRDLCPDCGKTAIEKFHIETVDKAGNTVRLITLECFHIIKKIIPKGTPFETFISNGWDDRVKLCKHEFPAKDESHEGIQINECRKCGEFKLRPFQIIGAKSAEAGLAIQKGFGIFDDMGLGKTVQALAVIKFHIEYTPTLYIVKSAIKFQWFKQIIRWLGPDYMPQVIATGKDYVFSGLKSYVISYDLLKRFPTEKIQALGIKLVVLDECQQIKNVDSSRTKEVRKLVGNPEIKVIPLSGTPWKNRGSEFFPVLNMLAPLKFNSQQTFLDKWVDYYYEGAKRKMGGIKKIDKFREYTQDIIIRREYNEVMDEFPDINRMKLNVKLDETMQETYDDEVSDFVKWYNEAVIGGNEDSMSSIEILGRMARMRHLTGLAKIPATVAFCEEFYEETDRKLVIFVHHQDVGQMLASELKTKFTDVPILEFTGTMSDEEKYNVAEKFNKGGRAFMVASTLAAGEGVDLQTCSDSVLHERQWNPQNEDQATPGRFRRIGQKAKSINITVPEAEGTIDEHVGSIVENKRHAFHSAMNKSEVPVWSESGFAKELAENIVKAYRKKSK